MTTTELAQFTPTEDALERTQDAAARAMIARAEQTAAAATGFEGKATLMNPAYLAHLQRVSAMFLNATMTPTHFRPDAGKGRSEAQCIADIAVVLDLANQLQVPPFQMLQNTYVVKGRPGLSTALMISLVAARGFFTGPIRYEIVGTVEGKDLAVTAWAIEKSDGLRVQETVTWATALAEGWTSNAKYQTMPVRMIQYRAAAWLIRSTHPEVLFGFHTLEEIETIDADVVPSPRVAASEARAEAVAGAPKATARLLGGSK